MGLKAKERPSAPRPTVGEGPTVNHGVRDYEDVWNFPFFGNLTTCP